LKSTKTIHENKFIFKEYFKVPLDCFFSKLQLIEGCFSRFWFYYLSTSHHELSPIALMNPWREKNYSFKVDDISYTLVRPWIHMCPFEKKNGLFQRKIVCSRK